MVRVLPVPTFAWNDQERQEVNAVRCVYTRAWLNRLGRSKREKKQYHMSYRFWFLF